MTKMGMKRTEPRKRMKPISDKQRAKNKVWRQVVLQRASQLREKYGHIICEYSGEPILVLFSVGEYMNDGWGHHIDGDRNNNTIENCYICKYKYHTVITDKNIRVSSEDFKTRELFY